MQESIKATPKVVTIDKLNEFTKQEIFDFVAYKLINQKEKSISVMRACLYTLELPKKTLHCAIGHLIPENLYNISLEGKIVSDVLVSLDIIIDDKLVIFLSNLQTIHDRYNVCAWYDRLSAFAESYSLEMRVDSLGNIIKN